MHRTGPVGVKSIDAYLYYGDKPLGKREVQGGGREGGERGKSYVLPISTALPICLS